MPRLNVILPCHNEAANLERVVDGLLQVLPQLDAAVTLTIVDDGSTDPTPEIVRRLGERYPNIRSIRHDHNRGYGGAVISGLRATDDGYAAIMDADGQFDATDLVNLFRRVNACDVVVGYRARRADPMGRRLLGCLWTLTGRCLFGIRLRDLNCGLKVFKLSAIRPWELQCIGPGINMEIMSQVFAAGNPVKEVGCKHRARTSGKQSGASLPVVLKGLSELAGMIAARRRFRPARKE